VRFMHERGDIEGIVIRVSNSFGAPAHQHANCWMLLVNDLCRQAVSTGQMTLRSSGIRRRDFVTLTDTYARQLRSC
jgi:UDP-glucose 4-epimerase